MSPIPRKWRPQCRLAVETFGRLDVIYNNAGITVSSRPDGKGLSPLTELPEAEMRRVEDVNINGVIYGAQAAIRQFTKQAEMDRAAAARSSTLRRSRG